MENYWYSKYRNRSEERLRRRIRLLWLAWAVQLVFILLLIARGH